MVYTKKGDDGTTSLVGGTRVYKNDIRVQTYGEIDYLVSLLGYVATFFRNDNYAGELFVIQNKLFEIESLVACEKTEIAMDLPQIQDTDVEYLERKIDAMSADLPQLKGFIIPSSSQTVCLLNVARTVTRKCERLMVECNQQFPQDKTAMKYMNRLSDYLFTLGRMVNKQKHRPEKYYKHSQNND